MSEGPRSQFNVHGESVAQRLERVIREALGRGHRLSFHTDVDNERVRVDDLRMKREETVRKV